jgi:hypothetical protein
VIMHVALAEERFEDVVAGFSADARAGSHGAAPAATTTARCSTTLRGANAAPAMRHILCIPIIVDSFGSVFESWNVPG